MNALTKQEKQACRKASEYYAALADGKPIDWAGVNGEFIGGPCSVPLAPGGNHFKEGCNFRILAPPKMRPFRDEELPELLGVKIQHNSRSLPYMVTNPCCGEGESLLEDYTYYDGPHKGQPVGKVVDA